MLTLQQRSYLKVMGIDIWLPRKHSVSYWCGTIFNQNGDQVVQVIAAVGNDADQEKALLSNILKALGQVTIELIQTEQLSSDDAKPFVVFGTKLYEALAVDAETLIRVDYTVEHLIQNPHLKAEVWKSLCQSSLLRSALLDHNHTNSPLSTG
ncbi:MAG: DNA polymerase III subunit psi [Coxiellaceae bacterium]|nr:DNA polymerase III subunit psi [Coxiellaceae bacterium]